MHSTKKARIQRKSKGATASNSQQKNATSKSRLRTQPGAPAPNSRLALDSKGKTLSMKSAAKGKAVALPGDLQPVASQDSRSLPTTFKIIVGSYEKLLYGLEGTFPQSPGLNTQDTDARSTVCLVPILKPIFIFPAHIGCVKAVAASPLGGKWLATGSADEIIKVWDLRRRKEIGGLMQHQGSITQLSFPSRSHLLSASEDGTLCLFRARDWTLLRSFKGHKDRINSFAVHPSGKLALSVGRDRTIRMWDFMRGKGSASTKIGKEGELIRWSPSGTRFAVQTEKDIDIYATNMTLLCQIHHPSRVQDMCFTTRVDSEDEILLVGAEDKKVSVYEMYPGTDVQYQVSAEFVGHVNRVKGISILSISTPAGNSTTYMTTVSSDGKILLYDLALIPPSSTSPSPVPTINPIASYDTKGTRLTCVAMADGELDVSRITSEKRKRGTDDEDEGQDADNQGGATGEEHSDGSSGD